LVGFAVLRGEGSAMPNFKKNLESKEKGLTNKLKPGNLPKAGGTKITKSKEWDKTFAIMGKLDGLGFQKGEGGFQHRFETSTSKRGEDSAMGGGGRGKPNQGGRKNGKKVFLGKKRLREETPKKRKRCHGKERKITYTKEGKKGTRRKGSGWT